MDDSTLKHDAIRRAFEDVTLDMIREFLTRKLSGQIHDNVKRKCGDANIDWEMAEKFIAKFCDIHEYYCRFIEGYVEEVLRRNILLKTPDYYWVFDRYLGEKVWTECFPKVKRLLPPDIYNM